MYALLLGGVSADIETDVVFKISPGPMIERRGSHLHNY